MGRNIIWLALAAAALPAVSSCSDAESLPLRADCIVEIELAWDDSMTTGDRAKTIALMFEQIDRFYRSHPSKERPNFALPGDDLDHLYAQFRSSCEQRTALAADLMSQVSRSVPTAPAYRVSHQMIEPGPTTINTWGPSWRDRPDQVIE
jgi:hypothetical protein